MNKKIIHVFPRDKFTEPYINFINENFDKNEHLFLILGSENSYNIKKQDNIIFIKKNLKYLNILIKYLYNSEKIILHSIFMKKIVYLLFLQPWLLKKSYWFIWGGDLYHYKFRKKNFKSNMYEFVRKNVIKNFKGLICTVKGEFELAKKWYKVKGKFLDGFYPRSMDFNYLDKIKNNSKNFNDLIIQIGNSADPTNKHIEIFKILSKFKDQKIKIITPLSYGNEKYAEEVIKKGKELFGDKYEPLTKFLPAKEYGEFLSSIDIAIFNHRRAQATGNIWALTYLGKKVYIRKEVTTFDYMKEIKTKIFSTENLSNENFLEFSELLNPEQKEKNRTQIKKYLSEEYCAEKWEDIFKD
jgi:hypothetical protein